MALLFCACSNKEYELDPLKNESLAYTSKFSDQKNNLIVIGNYLNPVYQGKLNLDKNKEFFIIGIYPKETKIKNLKINGKDEDLKIEVLNQKDEILELMNFKNPWSKYYKISISSSKADILNLNFTLQFKANEISQERPVFLSFRKNAKSLYWNPK